MSNSNRPGASGETLGEEHLVVLGEATPPDTGSPGGERDFGDSAGYGGGGSTRDFHDVVGDSATPRVRPNPLDAVMARPPGRRARAGGGRRPDIGLAFMAGSALLTASLGVMLWRRAGAIRRRKS
jgi:hypothetical protein